MQQNHRLQIKVNAAEIANDTTNQSECCIYYKLHFKWQWMYDKSLMTLQIPVNTAQITDYITNHNDCYTNHKLYYKSQWLLHKS